MDSQYAIFRSKRPLFISYLLSYFCYITITIWWVSLINSKFPKYGECSNVKDSSNVMVMGILYNKKVSILGPSEQIIYKYIDKLETMISNSSSNIKLIFGSNLSGKDIARQILSQLQSHSFSSSSPYSPSKTRVLKSDEMDNFYQKEILNKDMHPNAIFIISKQSKKDNIKIQIINQKSKTKYLSLSAISINNNDSADNEEINNEQSYLVQIGVKGDIIVLQDRMTVNFILSELIKIFLQQERAILLFEEFKNMGLPATHSIVIRMENYEKNKILDIDQYMRRLGLDILTCMIEVNNLEIILTFYINRERTKGPFPRIKINHQIFKLEEEEEKSLTKWTFEQGDELITLSRDFNSNNINFDKEFFLTNSDHGAFTFLEVITFTQDKAFLELIVKNILGYLIFGMPVRRQYIIQLQYVLRESRFELKMVIRNGVYLEHLKTLISEIFRSSKSEMNRIKKDRQKRQKKNKSSKKKKEKKGGMEMEMKMQVKDKENSMASFEASEKSSIESSILLMQPNDMLIIKSEEEEKSVNMDDERMPDNLHVASVINSSLESNKRLFLSLIKDFFATRFIYNMNMIGIITRGQRAILMFETRIEPSILKRSLLTFPLSCFRWVFIDIINKNIRNNKELEDFIVTIIFGPGKCRLSETETEAETIKLSKRETCPESLIMEKDSEESDPGPA